MSGTNSMGGVIAQGAQVEKLQEVQQQTIEWQKQRAQDIAEEEMQRQQRQVRKSSESEQGLAVAEKEARRDEREDSGRDPRKRGGAKAEEGEDSLKSAGHIIDIVV